jgi:hypothetical protein
VIRLRPATKGLRRLRPTPFPATGLAARPTPPPEPAFTPTAASSRATQAGMRALLVLIGVLLAAVVIAPIALSSQDLVAWAGSPDGLGLTRPWDVLTFVALDAAAAVCVGMVVYAAWRGEPAGAFGLLVWAFAATSAWANYRHGTRPGAPADAWWFFPAMSLAGPALLEVTMRRVRRWVQTAAGRYERPLPHFRLARWLIALPETWRAWRLAVTEGYWRPEDAIAAARAVGHADSQPAPTTTGAVEARGAGDGTRTPAPEALEPATRAHNEGRGGAAPDDERASAPEATRVKTSGATPARPTARATVHRGEARARVLAALDPDVARPAASLVSPRELHVATVRRHLRDLAGEGLAIRLADGTWRRALDALPSTGAPDEGGPRRSSPAVPAREPVEPGSATGAHGDAHEGAYAAGLPPHAPDTEPDARFGDVRPAAQSAAEGASDPRPPSAAPTASSPGRAFVSAFPGARARANARPADNGTDPRPASAAKLGGAQ